MPAKEGEKRGEQGEWEKVPGGWIYQVSSGWFRAYSAKSGCDHGPYQTKGYAASQIQSPQPFNSDAR